MKASERHKNFKKRLHFLRADYLVVKSFLSVTIKRIPNSLLAGLLITPRQDECKRQF